MVKTFNDERVKRARTSDKTSKSSPKDLMNINLVD